MKLAEEITGVEVPFEIGGSTVEEVYDSVLRSMCLIHMHFVQRNLGTLAREERRNFWHRLLPFWLIGWKDAKKFLEPIREYVVAEAEPLLDEQFDDAEVKKAYVRGVERFLSVIYQRPVSPSEVTSRSLSGIIKRRAERGIFYGPYDTNVNELFCDNRFRERICGSCAVRLMKL